MNFSLIKTYESFGFINLIMVILHCDKNRPCLDKKKDEDKDAKEVTDKNTKSSNVKDEGRGDGAADEQGMGGEGLTRVHVYCVIPPNIHSFPMEGELEFSRDGEGLRSISCSTRKYSYLP